MNSCPVCNKEFDSSLALYRDGALICRKCGIAGDEALCEEEDAKLDQNLNNLDLTKREVKAFLKDNAAYYLEKWENTSSKKSSRMGWNWSAFMFPFYWLAYRRMYRNAMVFVGLVYFVNIVFLILKLPFPFLIVLVSFGFLGLYGNSLYYNHMNRKIGEYKKKNGCDTIELEKLTKIGGVRFSGVLLIALFIFGFVLSFTILFVSMGLI